MKLTTKIASIGVMALALAVPGQAGAVVAATGPGAQFGGYVTPVVVAQQGGSLTYANADPLAPHNVVADGVYGATTKSWCTTAQRRDNTCPLFWSATIGVGQTPVLGLEATMGGGTMYPFFCTVHPGMKGTLVVV